MVYKWKDDPKGPTRLVKAEVVGKVLRRLEKASSGITTEAILAEARVADSPIHRWFEWDDTIAAEEYRKNQARVMVQQIIIVYESESDTAPVECRAFLNVTEDNRQQYMSTAKVLSDDELKRQVIDAVLVQIDHCKKKLQSFDEFAKVLEALANAQSELKKHKDGEAGRGMAGRGESGRGTAG